MIDHLGVVFWKYTHELITLDDVVSLISPAPALLAAVRSAPGGLPRLLVVISALLQERVPVREWRAITNRYLELVNAGTAPGQIVEDLRMLPAVRPSLPGNGGDARLTPISGSVADVVRRGIVRQGMAAGLVLDPEVVSEVLKDIRADMSGRRLPKFPVFVVEDAELRPWVRLLLAYEFPDIQVLSRREVLHPEMVEKSDAAGVL